jgi:hypothetical protein
MLIKPFAESFPLSSGPEAAADANIGKRSGGIPYVLMNSQIIQAGSRIVSSSRTSGADKSINRKFE